MSSCCDDKLEANILNIAQRCDTDIYAISAELDGNTLIINRNDGESFSVDLNNLELDDVFISGFDLVDTILRITRNDGVTFDIDLAGLEDLHITGLSLLGSVLTATRSDGVDFDVDLTSINTDTNTQYTLQPSVLDPRTVCLHILNEDSTLGPVVACVTIPETELDCSDLIEPDPLDCYRDDADLIATSPIGGCLISMPGLRGTPGVDCEDITDPAPVAICCDGEIQVQIDPICDQVVDDPTPAENALDCVEGEFVRRPLPAFNSICITDEIPNLGDSCNPRVLVLADDDQGCTRIHWTDEASATLAQSTFNDPVVVNTTNYPAATTGCIPGDLIAQTTADIYTYADLLTDDGLASISETKIENGLVGEHSFDVLCNTPVRSDILLRTDGGSLTNRLRVGFRWSSDAGVTWEYRRDPIGQIAPEEFNESNIFYRLEANWTAVAGTNILQAFFVYSDDPGVITPGCIHVSSENPALVAGGVNLRTEQRR